MPERALLADLKIPASEEFIHVAKMVAASVGGHLGFDLEEIDDLKIAVAQVCDSTIQEAMELWGSANPAIMRIVYSSTDRGIAMDVEVMSPGSMTPLPAGRPEAGARPSVAGVRDGLPTRRAAHAAEDQASLLARSVIRLFVDEFQQQIDSGSGEIRFRLVKYLIN
jgi:anti-sigma regulatory factor (Ser/Thr protein kinase)